MKNANTLQKGLSDRNAKKVIWSPQKGIQPLSFMLFCGVV